MMEESGEKSQPKVQRLKCPVKNYDWGCIGEESYVAKLYAANSGSGEIEADKHYAEFWMGTHKSGPSYLFQSGSANGVSQNITLKSWIMDNPDVLGNKVLDKWGSDLPFLFKALSIAKALSIQAHPDKELARVLHKAHPDVYKDDNHKPEMALAVTKFEALCGFISIEELKYVLCNVPEVVELVGHAEVDQYISLCVQDDEEKFKPILQSIFTKLMSASKEMITKAVSKLIARLDSESQGRQLTDKEQLVLRLEKQYPGDIGVISAFFLNFVRLNPGEALYLGANEPHAYISGECIECMAASDNVVRAGLTPKYRDVQTLCSMLTYKQGFPEILQGVFLNPYIRRYLPPFDEFGVDCCILPEGESTVFPAVLGPSIFMVTVGKGTMFFGSSSVGETVAEGDVLFVPANAEISVKATTELHIYRAGVNDEFLCSANKNPAETLHQNGN